ncbi:phospholipase A2-like [Lycorma delicatula]|uniref:phospholipase A2-like n=1 Tax=Lycorma delicatula TaxID=130591 RepID=UPI003F5170E9
MLKLYIMCFQLIFLILFVDFTTCYPQRNFFNTSNRHRVIRQSSITDLILPGTLWCGVGNIARGIDFGYFYETDKCCKAHDSCNRIISAKSYSSTYNLFNSAPYARLHCDCDDIFYRCLKGAEKHTNSAYLIGNIYFNLLFTKCFREAPPITGCAITHIKTGRCQEYLYNESEGEQWQWFDVKMY